MPYITADRIKATTSTTGTGTLTLGASPTGYGTFGSVMATNDTCPYIIAGRTTTEWEIGIGTYTSAGTTLARTTVIASSNGGSAVSLSSGTKDVSLGPCALLMGPKVASKGTAGATPTPNCLDGAIQLWDYTANATWGAPTNPPYAGFELTLIITQTSAGSYTTAWNATYHGGPAITAGATNTNASERFIYNGSNWDWIGGSSAFA